MISSFGSSFMASSDGDVFLGFICFGSIGFALWHFIFKKHFADEAEAVVLPANAYRPPALPARALFEVVRDARGDSTMFGFPVIFSSKLEADKYPNIVTGLTLNRDYIAVRRGSYGVKAFLCDASLTVGISRGCPPGFFEKSEYFLELQSETEIARFPVSFRGWLQIVDAARRGGASVAIDDDLPSELKNLIETPLPGDDSIKPVRTKAASADKSIPREVGRCRSCGSSIGRRSSCDYCGASQ